MLQGRSLIAARRGQRPRLQKMVAANKRFRCLNCGHPQACKQTCRATFPEGGCADGCTLCDKALFFQSGKPFEGRAEDKDELEEKHQHADAHQHEFHIGKILAIFPWLFISPILSKSIQKKTERTVETALGNISRA